MSKINDPFKEARKKGPVLAANFQGETIPMILRHKDVREATKDWETYSSDAPRRVPIPSEETVRTVRQYPLEVDPPEHTDYRKLVEPFFLRPKQPEVQAKIDRLIERLIAKMLEREQFDAVRDFAIPLQCHAHSYLLNVDEQEAEVWISWGVHVFKEGDGESKGSFMENYCEQMFLKAEENPSDDFFSALNRADFQGRKLTLEEKLGYANIAFAGGRDTIIHSITNIIHYFAENGKALECIHEHPDTVKHAAEEFFRVFMPLTHIGRVCPHDTNVHGHEVKAGDRVSLCWASANMDPEAFDEPEQIQLDRKPNPHISFGFGKHLCLGAHHARAVMRSLILQLANRVSDIQVHSSVGTVEEEAEYTRQVGFDHLEVTFRAR